MARLNERGLELSFKRLRKGAARGRWFTRIGGQPKYFGYGNGITDRQGYNEALNQFKIWQGKEEEKKRGLSPEDLQYEKTMKEWGRIIDASSASPVKTTVGTLLDEFLKEQEKRNDARHFIEQQQAAGKMIDESAKENISDSRLVSIQRDVKTFRTCCGADPWDGKEATAAAILKKYRDVCEGLLFNEKIAANTFNERIKLVRMFVGWTDTAYKLDRLPRNLKKLCAKYSYESSAKAIPIPMITKIWDAGDDREKLFIALALNLGYYSKDISDLMGQNIDGDYIAHTRGKTGVNVRYKLWGVTKTLLTKLRIDKDGTGRVLVSASGNPLNYYPERGKCRVDIVRNQWVRLCQKKAVKVKGYSFSCLRDTASTAIENFDRTLTDLFDCHSDKRMAAFYVDGKHVNTKPLDKAIDHLETLFGLTLEKGPKKEAKAA